MKKMKKYISISALFSVILFTSCEAYLNRTPESDLTDKFIFGNFKSFQGWAEQMYNCIADHEKCGNWNQYLFADETLNSSYTFNFDNGDYWAQSSYFMGKGVDVSPHGIPSIRGDFNEGGDPTKRRVWEWAWYAIAIANLTLEKLDEPGLFVGTDEERNLLRGQALYFRAWFHFEICRFWGGMPYISRALSPNETWDTPEFTRTSFQETALKMAADFRAAADILPATWDETTAGKATLGNNHDRANKIMALAYLGKAYLFAASPMMNEEAGKGDQFNAALCDSAADAFAELIKLTDSRPDLCRLETWDHIMNNFFMPLPNRSGQVEGIQLPTIYKPNCMWNSVVRSLIPFNCADVIYINECPTHNYVENFGDEKGYPLHDPDGVWNENDYWSKRDPRFYKFILFDTDPITAPTCQYVNVSDEYNSHKTLESYNRGFHKANPKGLVYCLTGYYQKKFTAMGSNIESQSQWDQLQAYVPFMRLADCYLMYAEAVNWKTNGGPKAKANNFNFTAEDIFNRVRARAQMPGIPAKFTTSQNAFFQEIIRERAVELCFEGQRFDDLRRWNLYYKEPYLSKTAFAFDRGLGDPSNPDISKRPHPINMAVNVIKVRVAEKNKHNWLPLQKSWTQKFSNFPQNPGW